MQLSGDTALAAAVDAEAREPVIRVEIDWNRDGLYSHAYSDVTSVIGNISLSRDSAGTLPEEITFVEGYASSRLSMTLVGQRPQDSDLIARLFQPFNVSGPLYTIARPMTPIRYLAGLREADGTVDYITRFTGVLTEFSVNADDDTVNISALDNSEKMRAPITLPVAAAIDTQAYMGGDEADWRINSQWLVDFIARKNGIYASPPPHSRCLFSVTGHGSMIPDIGTGAFFYPSGTPIYPTTNMWTQSRFGTMLAMNGTQDLTPSVSGYGDRFVYFGAGNAYSFQIQGLFGRDNNLDPSVASNYAIGCSLYHPANNGAGGFITFWVNTAGFLQVKFYHLNGVTSLTVTGPQVASGAAAWHDVRIRIHMPDPLTSCTIRWELDGVVSTTSGVNVSGYFGGFKFQELPVVILGSRVPISNMQLCEATNLADTATFYNPTSFVPQADIDVGLNRLSGLPEARGVDSYDLMKEIVNAEFGQAGFTESGRFFFKNRDNARRDTLTVNKSVNTVLNLSSISLTERADSVRNIISVNTSERRMGGRTGPVFELDNVNQFIAPSGLTEFFIPLGESLSPNFGELIFYNSAAWDDYDNLVGPYVSAFCAVDTTNFTECPNVRVWAVPMPDEYLIKLVVENPYSISIRFENIGGDPTLQIAGFPIYDAPTVATLFSRASSIAKYGQRVFEISAGPFVQKIESFETISLALLKDMVNPTPVITSATIEGDPRLQINDSIYTLDQRLGGPIRSAVYGIDHQFSPEDGMTDTLALRVVAYPGRWILNDPVYGVLNVTTIPG